MVVLKEQNLLIFLDLAFKFCMLHELKEPTRPTATEAEADYPQNPVEESLAGIPHTDQRRSHRLC